MLIQVGSKSVFPYGTLAVNIIGCMLIGLVFSLADKGSISQEWRLYLATGLIGGFTTFSAFSIETLNMLHAGRALSAILYVALSVTLGLVGTYLGILIASSTG